MQFEKTKQLFQDFVLVTVKFIANTMIFSAFHLASDDRTLKHMKISASSIHALGKKLGKLKQTHTSGLNKRASNNN